MKTIAVILSGCGHKDGSEITEAVSSLIALGNEKAQYECFAPSLKINAVNFLTDEKISPRDALEESARIARGDIKDLKTLDETKFDALLFPGGYGAANNLSNWGTKGATCTVLPEVEKVITAFYKAQKPIGAICIAPTLLAKVLGRHHITLTIGNDKETAQEITKTGAIHEDCPVEEYISDRNNKVLTTPAYMYDTQPHLVFKGISKMIKELVEMA
jgi:enhancing lycopene biosynthesis protein 2